MQYFIDSNIYMAHLPLLIRTRFFSPKGILKKTNI